MTSHSNKTNVQQQLVTATALIYREVDNNIQVFMAKRADSKKLLPGVWEIPGGHIEFGEEITEGLVREIMEEFGKTIELGDPFFAFTYTNQTKNSHSIEVIYFAQFSDTNSAITLNPKDHSAYKWFYEDEIRQPGLLKRKPKDPEYVGIQKGLAILSGR